MYRFIGEELPSHRYLSAGKRAMSVQLSIFIQTQARVYPNESFLPPPNMIIIFDQTVRHQQRRGQTKN